MFYDPLYLIIIGLSTLVSWAVGSRLRKKMDEYAQVPMPLSGHEVALEMLRQHGLQGVRVTCVPGKLTDHYDPRDRSVNLSEFVYHGYSVAAAAVAAHECGHAVQHAKSYSWLQMRSKMVPVVSLSSNLSGYVLMAGVIMAASGAGTTVLLIGVALLSVAVAFAFVTLPVEFDASRRALAWLSHSRLASSVDHSKAQNALFWAAMTYVVGALAALGQLLYWGLRLLNASERE